MGVFHGIWTLLLLLVFLGIVVWVWSSRRKKHFEEAGRIPFQEEHPVSTGEDHKAEKNDG